MDLLSISQIHKIRTRIRVLTKKKLKFICSPFKISFVFSADNKATLRIQAKSGDVLPQLFF